MPGMMNGGKGGPPDGGKGFLGMLYGMKGMMNGWINNNLIIHFFLNFVNDVYQNS